MKFTVHFERQVAEQSTRELQEIVIAESVEDAILGACSNRLGRAPHEGEKYTVSTTVVVGRKTKLPLRDPS